MPHNLPGDPDFPSNFAGQMYQVLTGGRKPWKPDLYFPGLAVLAVRHFYLVLAPAPDLPDQRSGRKDNEQHFAQNALVPLFDNASMIEASN